MIYLTSYQIRLLDKLAIEEFQIPGLILMEHASLGLALEVESALSDTNKEVLILCGRGNNGGDGMAAARHLHNRGFAPEVLLAGRMESMKPGSEAAVNARILRHMGIPFQESRDPGFFVDKARSGRHALVLDAFFGTGLARALEGIYQELFPALNELDLPLWAVDVPSGLNADTGEIMGVALRARKTVTFAFAKEGFRKGHGPELCGEIVVKDIGLPRELREDPFRFLQE